MKSLRLALIGALPVARMAYAQQPPDVVVSDHYSNTAMGTGALLSVTPSSTTILGSGNTAAGAGALSSNTTGFYNTASGAAALKTNTTGFNDVAIGYIALTANTTGSDMIAIGSNTLSSNTTGGTNIALGTDALSSNTTGYNNGASGSVAIAANTTGYSDVATGYDALRNNTTGAGNVAIGDSVLVANTTANSNIGIGTYALTANTTGGGNTAAGQGALASNTTGYRNLAMGYQAGFNLTTGSNNIDIGNVGVAAEGNTIRIGAAQTRTYIAGIYGTPVTGSAVYIASTGQLGGVTSTERFKTAIASMGSNTEKLQRLRPVTFHLKTDPTGALQYGLIAEEVANVYPELVIRDDKGRIDGVRYDELAPMLLNEVQQQAAEIRDLKQQQQERIAAQDRHSAAQDAKISQLMGQLAEMYAAIDKLKSKDGFVAQR